MPTQVFTFYNGAEIVPLPSIQYADVQIVAQDAVASAISPWTKQGNFYQFGTQWWEAVITFAAMDRANIAPWQAFLLQLQGQTNVFQLSIPGESYPQSVALNSGVPTNLNLTPDPGFIQGLTFWNYTAGTVQAIPNYSPLNNLLFSPGSNPSLQSSVFTLPAGSYNSSVYYGTPPSADCSGLPPTLGLYDADTGLPIFVLSLSPLTQQFAGFPGGQYNFGGFTLSTATNVP